MENPSKWKFYDSKYDSKLSSESIDYFCKIIMAF